jgi:hypothetical protein
MVTLPPAASGERKASRGRGRERERRFFRNSERERRWLGKEDESRCTCMLKTKKKNHAVCYWDMHQLLLGQADRWASIVGLRCTHTPPDSAAAWHL